MKKQKTKFMESPFLVVGYSSFLILGFGLVYMTYLSPIKTKESLSIFSNIMIIFFLAVLPTLVFIFYIHRGASIIEITEAGIKKSLFRIFYKREIKWEELKEMRVIFRVNAWLFVSKNEMKNYYYDQLVKRKDTIQLTLSKALIVAIRQYTDKEIIGWKEK